MPVNMKTYPFVMEIFKNVLVFFKLFESASTSNLSRWLKNILFETCIDVSLLNHIAADLLIKLVVELCIEALNQLGRLPVS